MAKKIETPVVVNGKEVAAYQVSKITFYPERVNLVKMKKVEKQEFAWSADTLFSAVLNEDGTICHLIDADGHMSSWYADKRYWNSFAPENDFVRQISRFCKLGMKRKGEIYGKHM